MLAFLTTFLTPILLIGRRFYLLRIFLHVDMFVRNIHKKFSAYIAENYKPKGQHPAKATT